MGSFLFHDKPFTQKLSEQNYYPEVVKIPKGCHRVVIVYQKVVIRLSYGCHNGSRWIVMRLSVKQKWYCDDPTVVSKTTF